MASIKCRYADGTTKICNDTTSFSDIKVNGTSIGLQEGYNVDSGDVVEFVLNGYNILSNAFQDVETLTSVELNGIGNIGEDAFTGCSKLTSVIGLDYVSDIGERAFENCVKLTGEIVFCNYVKIHTRAFAACNISNIKFGLSPYIYAYAFRDNKGLSNLVIPKGTMWGDDESYGTGQYGYYAFWNCINLETVEIGVSIPAGCFAGCTKLESVKWTAGTSLGDYAFEDCSSLKRLEIPEGVKKIGDGNSDYGGVFSGCRSLSTLILPTTLESIDSTCFSNCYSLDRIYAKSVKPPTINYRYFDTVKMYGTLYYPEGSNYSSWLSKNDYYLGYYEWNSMPINAVPKFELDTDLINAPYTGLRVNVGVVRENITTLDIEYPDWIAVTDMDDYFAIDIFENEGNERSDYITFIIDKDEITELIIKLKVMQEAMETPENLRPIWKDYEYTFGGTDVTYGIYTETRYVPPGGRPQDVVYIDNLIFKGRAYAAPNESVVKVNLNKICQNYLGESSLVFDGAVGVGNSFNKYKLKDGYGNLLETLYFVGDWSYKPLTLGIKTNPITPNIANGQKLFFSLLAEDSRSVQWGMKYSDATEDYTNTEYLSNGFETVIVPKSREKNVRQFHFGGKNYGVLPKCQCKWVLYYLNPNGGYDWFTITGRVTRRDKLQTYTITQNFNNTTTNFGKKRYLSTIGINYQINTQWLTQAQSDRMWELLESNQVWLHNLETDEIMPVIITDTDIEHKQKTRTNKMISYQINVELSQGRERI